MPQRRRLRVSKANTPVLDGKQQQQRETTRPAPAGALPNPANHVIFGEIQHGPRIRQFFSGAADMC